MTSQETSQETSQATSPSKPKDDDDDFDGLSAFFSSFQVALVFFVLPPIHHEGEIHDPMIEQLDEIDSYFQKAQRLSIRHQQEAEAATPTNTKSEGASTTKSCVMLVPNTESAIESLTAIADSLLPERKANKELFLRQLQSKFFIPPLSSKNKNPASLPSMTETFDPDVVASHVAKGLFEMAETFELPPRDVEILMSELGDLKTIATADDSVLERIPIDSRTRKVLHSFFGSPEGRKGPCDESRYLEGSTTSQQGHANQEYPDLHGLASFATRQPPQPNHSLARNSHTPPHERSDERPNRHPFQAHHQLPTRFDRQGQHRFVSSVASESWMQQDFLVDSFDDGIPEDEYNFHISNDGLDINDGASHFPAMVPMQAHSFLRRDRDNGSDRHDPGFSSNYSTSIQSSDMRPSAFSRNENYDSLSFSGQSLNGNIWSRREPMPQRYSNSSHRNVPQRYHTEQPAYGRSQHFNVEDKMNNIAGNSRQHNTSDLPVSSRWQSDSRPEHRYQNHNSFYKSGFLR